MSSVIVHPVEYVIEIQRNGKPEGVLCAEGLEVRVHDLGGGPFISIKGRNLDPDEEFDIHMVCLDETNIEDLCHALDGIMRKAKGSYAID